MRKIFFILLVFIWLGSGFFLYSQDMKEDSQLWLKKAQQFYEKKDFQKAQEAVKVALELWKGNKEAQELLDKLENKSVIDSSNKETGGWKEKKVTSAVKPVEKEVVSKIVEVNGINLDEDEDVYYWMKKGDTLYQKGDLKKALDAYEIAYEMAPNDSILKNKIEKTKIALQNAHFKNLYPVKKPPQVEKPVPYLNDKPVALKVVSSQGKLISAKPVYQEVKVENKVPQVPVSEIPLVDNDKDIVEVDKLNQILVVKIKKGVTFEKLFKKYLKNYRDMKAVARFNGIKNINKLSVGKEIKIPAKYLNDDYREQYFPNYKTQVVVKKIVAPRGVSYPKEIKVKEYKLAQLKSKMTSLMKNQESQEIESLKKQIKDLKLLILKMNQKIEKENGGNNKVTKTSPIKTVSSSVSPLNKGKSLPANLPQASSIAKKINNKRKKIIASYKSAEEKRKEALRALAKRLSEKERRKRIESIREKLKQLRMKYFHKLNEEKKVSSTSEKEKYQKEIKELRTKIYNMSMELFKYKKEIKKLKAQKAVSVETLKKLVKEYKKRLAQKEALIKKIQSQEESKAIQEVVELKKKIRELEKELSEAKKNSAQTLQQLVNQYKKRLAQKEKLLAEREARLQKLLAMERELQRKLKTLEKSAVKSNDVLLLAKENQGIKKELERRKDLILKLNKMLEREKKQRSQLLTKLKSLEKKLKEEEKKNNDQRYKELQKEYRALKKKLLEKEKALAMDKTIASKKLILSPASAQNHYKLAMEYWKKGLFDEAISEYKKAIDLNPSYLLKNDRGLTDAAISWAKTTLKGRRGFLWELRYKLAQIYQKKGYIQKALNEYREMLKDDPNNAEVYYNMGVIFEQIRNYRAAINAYEKISSLPSVSDKYVRMATDRLEELSRKHLK